MYNLIIYLYLCGVAIASLFNEKVRKMWRGEREAIRVLREKVDPQAQYVWFHAASLGEFEQGRPLMERLRRDHPEYKILLTFFSPSGYEVRKNYDGADIVCYLPLDTISNARRFLRTVRPVMAFFIKYEFWYNYLHILKHRGVPVYSVSSIFRPNQVFFRWYGRQYSRVLKCFTQFFVQNEVSKELLATLGIHNVDVVGDTRFDRVLQVKEAAESLENVAYFCHYNISNDPNPDDDEVVTACAGFVRPAGVFVAGSSWPPDEDIFIRYFRDKQLFGYGKWKLIIAPHVIDESHLQEIEQKLDGYKVVRYTKFDCYQFESADVLIVDCYGLLSSIYRYGDIAYVGGGFGVGIHNVVEAAVWGKPVFFGPNNQRFQEAQGLKACGGGIEIGSYDDFAARMDQFVSQPQSVEALGRAAADYVSSRAGAVESIFSIIGL
ncbi:MAG: 3-deoxy-D-manno-octulosonic acid transferase [Prevotella sp.]|nr:3-deoxy-D-manno-octulosonic acid transferase [Prevotella sp.]